MPEKETLERARRARREGKRPTTQAGEFIREELDDAEYVGDGAFLLKSGALVRFLTSATIH